TLYGGDRGFLLLCLLGPALGADLCDPLCHAADDHPSRDPLAWGKGRDTPGAGGACWLGWGLDRAATGGGAAHFWPYGGNALGGFLGSWRGDCAQDQQG